MDTFTIRYEKLFSIALSHADFLKTDGDSRKLLSLGNELRFEPDTPTNKLFNRCDIIPRLEEDVFCCYIRTEVNGDRPFRRLPVDFSARFLLVASSELIARSSLAPYFGGEKVYHIRVKLKTTTATTQLRDNLLATVPSNTPELIFFPGYGDQPDLWQSRTTAITGCLGVLDIVTEGNGKNRLFRQEASQLLNYTVGNGKANEHLYTLILKA